MLTAEQVELIRARLLKKIKRTEAKVASMEEMAQPIGPENAIGRISRMDAINNKSVMEAALRNARKDLSEMQKALIHLEDPDFGLCQKCGSEIPIERLILMPGSGYCVNCARMR